MCSQFGQMGPLGSFLSSGPGHTQRRSALQVAFQGTVRACTVDLARETETLHVKSNLILHGAAEARELDMGMYNRSARCVDHLATIHGLTVAEKTILDGTKPIS